MVAAREAKVIGACLNHGVHAVQQNMTTVSAPAQKRLHGTFMDFFATRISSLDFRLPPLVPDGRVGLCPPVSSSLDGCGPGCFLSIVDRRTMDPAKPIAGKDPTHCSR